MPKTVCFTGHREIPRSYLAALPARVDNMLDRLYAANYRTFVTGGAEGFDTLVAMRVIEMRKKCPDVRLVLSLPYERVGGAAYRRTLEAADEIEYVARDFQRGSLFERDRRMVDRSSACIAFYIAGRGGGTLYTVRYANKKGVPVVNIAD